MDTVVLHKVRHTALHVLTFIMAVLVAVFGISKHALTNNAYALFEIGFAVILVFNLIYYRITGNYRVASSVLMASLSVLGLFLLVTGGFDKTGIYWIFSYPVIAFFFKDGKHAFLWNTLMLLFIIILAIFDYIEQNISVYTNQELRQALGAYVASLSVAVLYNRTIHYILEGLREKAIKDELTGVYNRSFILEYLKKATEKLNRDKSSGLCVVYVDVNDFKKLNDTHGHGKGDEVLKLLVRLLEENLRSEDIIGRIGGDEFLIVMSDCDKSVISRIDSIFEKINRRLKDYNVSLSYGLAVAPHDAVDMEDLLDIADMRMYKVKRSIKHSISGQKGGK